MCCNKRTGVLIIGILGIIYSIIISCICINTLVLVSSEPYPNDMEKTIKIILNVAIGFCCLNLILNALLIYGAEQRSRFLLLPWLIYTAVGNGIVLVGCLFFISKLPIGELVSNCISWALWAVVLRFYIELCKNKRSAARNLNQEQTTNVEKGFPTVRYFPQQPAYVKEGL